MRWEGPLVGRRREERRLAAMEGRAARGRACAVLFVGEPGVGKTALLERFASTAGAPAVLLSGADHRLRDASGSAVSLLELPFHGRPMRRSTAVRLDALWRENDFDAAAAAAAVLACAATGARSPITYLVDDLDLLDPRSRNTVNQLVADATSEPVTVVATSRRPLADWPARSVPLRPLPDGVVVDLLTDEGLHRSIAAELAMRTAGNPLAARSTAATLTGDQRAGIDALPERLPLDARLVAARRSELEPVAEPTRAAVLADASSGEAGAVGAVMNASLLATVSPAERRGAHRIAAGNVDGPEALRQLAAAADGPDAVLSDELAAAARRCLEDRDVPGAVDLLVAAGEVAPRGGAGTAWYQAAVGCYLTAQNRRALELVGALRSLSGPEEIDVRLDRLEGLAGLHVYGLDDSIERLERAAGRAARAGETEATLTLLLIAGVFSLYGCRVDDLDAFAEKAKSLVTDDPLTLATVAVFSASADLYARVDTSPLRGLAPLLDAASSAHDEPPEPIPDLDLDPPRTQFFAGLLCLTDERWDVARRLLGLTAAHDEAAGWTALVGLDVAWYAEVLWRQGAWTDALDVARRALEAPGPGLGRSRVWIDAFLAKAELLVGAAVASGRHRAAVDADADSPLSIPLAQLAARAGTGLGMLGAGNTDDALDQLLAAEEIGRNAIRHPGLVWWRAELVEALAAAGRRRDALEAADELSARLGEDPPPVLRGRSLRARGLAVGGRRGATLLGRAVAAHETGGSPFELARSLLALAEARHALGDDDSSAADTARRAHGLFNRLGATSFAARASRIGVGEDRPAAMLGRLTPREAEVARLVAGGATNQDVAAELRVSAKTVGFHLEAVFRKLHVNRRSQLAALLTTEPR